MKLPSITCPVRYFALILLFGQCLSFSYSRMWRNKARFASFDQKVSRILEKEEQRQSQGLALIASENYVSANVQDMLASCFTNKYSEGLPNRRYYSGNKYVDNLEILCQERALKLFNLNSSFWSVNVQPYSGSVANLAVYLATLQPGETLMGLSLQSGGHLSHGFQTLKRKVTATALYYNSVPYFVDSVTGLIDYEDLERQALTAKPKLIIAGASAYPRNIDYARIRQIANLVNATLMGDISHVAGIVANSFTAGDAPSVNPFDYCDVITTTTHKTLRGPRGALIFSRKELSDAIDRAVFPGLQGGPHNNNIAAIAVALKEAQRKAFSLYIDRVLSNAQELGRELQRYGYHIVTNGTDNHMLLINLRPLNITGSVVEKLLEFCDIFVNKNVLASDTSALNPFGIRIGTPAVTTRGMSRRHMRAIASCIHQAITVGRDLSKSLMARSTLPPGSMVPIEDYFEAIKRSGSYRDRLLSVREEVHQLTEKFPTFHQFHDYHKSKSSSTSAVREEAGFEEKMHTHQEDWD